MDANRISGVGVGVGVDVGCGVGEGSGELVGVGFGLGVSVAVDVTSTTGVVSGVSSESDSHDKLNRSVITAITRMKINHFDERKFTAI